LKVANLSVTPDPITGSGAALPFRWEVTYNPDANGKILHTEFDYGAPQGAVGGFLFRFPDAGNVIGSATYGGLPQTPPVFAGLYPAPAAGWTAGGVTLNGQFTLLKDFDATVVQSIIVTLEKQELGVLVEIPGISYQNIHQLDWLTPGDYILQVQMFDNNGGMSVCNQIGFTTVGRGATAPIAFHAAPEGGQGQNNTNQ
jgi:hypothetical protein